MNILCYSTTDWDAPQFGSRQQIMLRLSRTHKVLFVEPQLGLHHATRSRGTHGVRDLNRNLRILSTGYALPFRFHRAGQWINDALLQQY